MSRGSLALLLLAAPGFAAAPPVARTGALVIVGGGPLPVAVERRFIDLAGGKKARLIVIPTASITADAADAQTRFLERWRKHGLASVTLVHTRRRAEADTDAFVRPLREATGIWLSGGDQSRLTAAYRGTAVERELKRLVSRGGVVGGTSAGAAVLSTVMIARGRREAELSTGLGLLTDLVVDQHFLRRDRVDRLLSVLADKPHLIGLGIDESTATIIQGRSMEVVGESYVLAIVPGGKMPRIRVLRSGDRLDLRTLRGESKR
jgi:cyanophycinase